MSSSAPPHHPPWHALALAAGDAAILSSAFFFSLATVRLGTYARAIPAVELAAAKSLVLGGALLGGGLAGLWGPAVRVGPWLRRPEVVCA